MISKIKQFIQNRRKRIYKIQFLVPSEPNMAMWDIIIIGILVGAWMYTQMHR